ncbi:hypothetical protein [Agromyces sp. ZXT2-6]|uniref:hypothetical protein n=1 Tax=Agromyces sp. ZXT2-6 TaxID=3461153 RepID=UPI0040552BEB
MADQSGEAPTPDDEPRIRVRSGNGEWRELKGDRPKSDDPEVEALWNTNIAQLESIAADESHPLHAKAVEVSRQAVKPIHDALTDDVARRLKSWVAPHAFRTPVDRSWLGGLVVEYPDWRNISSELPASVVVKPPSIVGTTVDFDAMDLPDATASEVERAAEDKAQQIRLQQVGLLEELVRQAREDSASSQESLEVAKGARKAGWWAVAGGFLAVAVSVVGIIVTVIVSK